MTKKLPWLFASALRELSSNHACRLMIYGAVISFVTFDAAHLSAQPAIEGVRSVKVDRVKSARHIRARVAIRYRINIQTVDTAGMALHRVAEGNHGVTQGIRPKFFKNCHIARLLRLHVMRPRTSRRIAIIPDWQVSF